MKKSILIMSIGILMTSIALSGCQSSTNKTQNAKDNMLGEKIGTVDSVNSIGQVQQDSITAFQNFKEESEAKLESYQDTITSLKGKIAKEGKIAKVKYEKKLAVIEQKNNDLKQKLEDFKYDGQGKWVTFKTEFNHNMDDLGDALSAFFTSSKK